MIALIVIIVFVLYMQQNMGGRSNPTVFDAKYENGPLRTKQEPPSLSVRKISTFQVVFFLRISCIVRTVSKEASKTV